MQEACLTWELILVLEAKVWRFEEVVSWELLQHAMGLRAPRPGMASSLSTGNESFEARETGRRSGEGGEALG